MACKSLRRLGSAVFLILLAACGGEDPHLTRPTVEISAAAPTEAPSAEAAAPAVSPVPITVQTITPLPPTAAATLAPTKTRRSQTAAPTYAPLDPALPAPPTAVPTPVPLLPRDETMTLYALLGNDVQTRQGGRTDSIILAAVNARAKTISLLSIPRDLYVVIPGWTMQRINLAYAHGAGDGRDGADLFRETVAYNLGLPLDHTVRVGFDGFVRIVDAVGGIEVVVNCPIDDWRLKAPDLDPQLESSWQPFELGYGLQEMDGDLALWYARSRRSTNDFDRGRRQQKLLRALWQKSGASAADLAQLPALLRALWPAVQTDLTFGEALQLAALAPQLEAYTVRSFLLPQEALRPWRVPGSGAAVQLLDWQMAEATLHAFLAAPALHAASSAPIRVAIQSGDFVLYRQAAENLAWYGFEAVYEPPTDEAVPETTITYYGPSLKGVYPERLAWILRRETAAIQLQPRSADEAAGYNVLLAPDYNPCLDYLGGPPGVDQSAVKGEQ